VKVEESRGGVGEGRGDSRGERVRRVSRCVEILELEIKFWDMAIRT
jgi:hypothetical protein